MAKIDKIQQARMDGLVRGLEIAEKKGIDELKKEVKFRGATKLQFEINMGKADEIYRDMLDKVYATFTVVCYQSIHDLWGYGEKRLKSFKDKFDSYVETLSMVDYYGYRYIEFRDMAKKLNEKYNLDINMDKIEQVDILNRNSMDMRASIPAIYELLKQNGYTDASLFLKEFFPEAFKNRLEEE